MIEDMDEVNDLIDDATRPLKWQIQRVRELHKPFDSNKNPFIDNYGICCMACEVNDMPVEYPCPTIKALDGEQE
jgi:hypothetical protein